MTLPVALQDVLDAADRIAGRAHVTPVITCSTLDRMAGAELFFKCEQFQRVGAFKFRGALNAVTLLSDEDAAKGVVTHSSGNHAQALALAAQLRGIPAHIVMPTSAPHVKRNAVRGYGATVIDCEPTLVARLTTAAIAVKETGGVLIPPYNHVDVIAGQGTCALELLDQVPDLDAIIAPVGGGGLISGICVGANGVRVIAAEPSGADDAARSKAAGKFIPQKSPRTIADGLLTSLGDLTWPYVRDVVEEVVTVDDRAIVEAMRLLWERAKLLVEASSATALAAAMVVGGRRDPSLRRIGVVLTGGNVDLGKLPF